MKLTVRIVSDGIVSTTASAIFFKLRFACPGLPVRNPRARLPDVVHGPFRKLKRVCVNKRHAQLSYGILRGRVSGVFRNAA